MPTPLPLYDNGSYWVRAAEFGTGRLKPKSKGYEVLKSGLTHSTVCARIGYDGARGLKLATEEADRRAKM